MENNRSKKKVLKWSFLIFLILVASFAILFGINMHAMQSAIISEIIQYIDTGELNKIGSVDRKGIVINHYFLFYSFSLLLNYDYYFSLHFFANYQKKIGTEI